MGRSDALSANGFKLSVFCLELCDQLQSLFARQRACGVEDTVSGRAVVFRLAGGLPQLELDAVSWSICQVIALWFMPQPTTTVLNHRA
jgi:hypothetical protein